MAQQPSFKNLTSSSYGRPEPKQHAPLQELTKPHIESFNYMLHEGLQDAVKNIPPVEFSLPSSQRVSLFLQEAAILPPAVPAGNIHATNRKVYPAECREGGKTYRGRLRITTQWTVDNHMYPADDRFIGEIPIMVKSDVCSLADLPPAELIRRGEEAQEMGGYFIINGNERIIRMLIMPRRNFPTALVRPSWTSRGKHYTQYGVSMRCVARDQTAANMVLHYLNNGTATLSFTYRKEQFFVPIIMILKALVNVTDQYIYKELMKGKEENSFYKGCIASMLRQARAEGLASRSQILEYIGKRFRIKLSLPEWKTDEEVAQFLLKQCICIHLETNMDKFHLLVYMTRKLFSFAKGECATESADNPMNQELLLGGHLYLMVLKEKLENWLLSVKAAALNKATAMQKKGKDYTLDVAAFNDACRHSLDLTKSMEYLLATGNLVSRTGLGLMQVSGLTVVADKLNFMRYLSHFRCVHRGAFFAEMRTTAVRKLLPEAWGFLCPVHTPDGAPCGLMNHLSALCQVVNLSRPNPTLPRLLATLGMQPFDSPAQGATESYTVMLDGRLLGWVGQEEAKTFVEKLRYLKVKGLEKVPSTLEICFVPRTKVASQYPGIFLFTNVARMIRPVKNLALDSIEMIGTFEQVYMNICIIPEEAHPGVTTHQELNECSMLSAVASLTPFSDFNQSPRNMYQCQMGKQTMATPGHALGHRADNKLYRIQTPQTPMVRPAMYDHYDVDNYPIGTNAVVAVISYTGYDMEDAMILNKGSFERGFGHGSIIKSEHINLKDVSRERGSTLSVVFGNKPGDKRTGGRLDEDGLPFIGTYLTQGDPYYSYVNVQTGELKLERYRSQEPAYVDQVKIIGNDLGTGLLQHVCIVLRIQRNPIIGDKFSSRHGQKGICSQKWPVSDMPFTESGMTPDIIFNPHGFPSRMTIGMMIESMAGKSAAMHGLCHDATAFTFSEETPAIDHFGNMLVEAGYNYYGTERLYSGVDGRELEADIFIGIVYYQRLRHMVADKFQVRTTGPIDQVTHQPVKGRKRAGGVRFGEMERDALLAHGTAFLLQDRLLNCSDRSKSPVCVQCGSLASPSLDKPAAATAAASIEAQRTWTCLVCKRKDAIQIIDVPYVFRYLVAELAAMSIKVRLDIQPSC